VNELSGAGSELATAGVNALRRRIPEWTYSRFGSHNPGANQNWEVAVTRKPIDEKDHVSVGFSAAEKTLLEDEVFADPDYLKRLAPDGSGRFVGGFTLYDLEDLVGSIAAAANHSKSAALERKLDRLYERLETILESYDDGNWQDSL
jgi:hypothetical protein